MPPIPDRKLEERILKATQRLWRTRGEQGLTLRAVAHEAGTTTPTLYKRFRSKEALRLALANRLRDELNAELFSSSSIEDVYRRYLHYAESNPHEYELLRRSFGHFLAPGDPRPARVWLLRQLASRFGGQPEEYVHVFDALFLLCHGAATLVAVVDHQPVRAALRDHCIEVCDRLIANVAILRAGK